MLDVRIDNYFIINDLTIIQTYSGRNVSVKATIFHYNPNRGKITKLFDILQVFLRKKRKFNTKTLSYDTIGLLKDPNHSV